MKSYRRVRTGEKFGWVGGWAGAFAWIPVLAVLFAFRDQQPEALVGLGLTGLGSERLDTDSHAAAGPDHRSATLVRW